MRIDGMNIFLLLYSRWYHLICIWFILCISLGKYIYCPPPLHKVLTWTSHSSIIRMRAVQSNVAYLIILDTVQ